MKYKDWLKTKKGQNFIRETSERMKDNNPMKNKNTVKKRLKKVDYKAIGKKISKTRKKLFKEGKIKAHCIGKKGINKGSKNGNYIDGYNEREKQEILKITKNQNYKCLFCKSKKLIPHHMNLNQKKYKDNIVMLCNKHHNLLHQRGYNFHKSKWKINVCEQFVGIQGEGKSIGRPSLFFRLSFCSMKCPWCDSKYSWNESKEYNYLDCINLFKKIKKENKQITNIIITGGEPLEQNIQPLIMIAKIFGFKVEIETNGQSFKSVKLPLFVDQYNVSPKLWSKEKIRRFRKERIELFNKENSIWKFVLDDDMKNNFENFLRYRNIPKDKIYIMPKGTTRKEQFKEMPKIIEYCIQKGFKFSPRIHIIIYNDKRGV